MSRLEEILEPITSQFVSLWEKIQESEAFNQLKDRYQTLTPSGQKLVQLITVLVVAGVLLYSPMSQLQISHTLVEEFEVKRNLIRDLFKTYHDSPTASHLNPAPASAELIASIQSSLQGARLVPEQIVSVNAAAAEGKLIPQNLLLEVIEVKLSKLNLRQIVDIGTNLANLSHAVKVKDMLINAHADMAGYFDVNYKLYSLKVPDPIQEAPPEVIEPKKGKKKKTEDTTGDE